MLRIRNVLQHGGVVRTGHVGGHRLDPGLRAAKPFPEGFQGLFALSFAHEDDRSCRPVNHNGEEFVLLANVDFVDGNDLQISQTRLAELLLQVLLIDAPNHRITDAHRPSHIPNGHHLSQVDHMASKGLRVIAQRHDVRQDGIQHLFATPTFQSRGFDEQDCPVFADRSGMHNSIKCPAMNHFPIATLRTLVTRWRGFHPDLKYPVFSPTALMLVA